MTIDRAPTLCRPTDAEVDLVMADLGPGVPTPIFRPDTMPAMGDDVYSGWVDDLIADCLAEAESAVGAGSA